MKRFLIITIFLMTFNSEARLKIEIAKCTEQLQKIAIVPFNSNINSQFEYQVRNLINEKLTLFGEFESLDLSQMLSFPFNEANFFARDWELLSIDYVIFGEITETDESLEINYVVSDINLKRIVLRGGLITTGAPAPRFGGQRGGGGAGGRPADRQRGDGHPRYFHAGPQGNLK